MKLNLNKNYPKIVLTGGPCAGKTTAKNFIQQELTKQGYTVFFLSETATEVLKSGITPDTVGLYKFQKAVISLQIQKEELFVDVLNQLPSNIKPILICDRGVPDSKAFCHIGMYEDIIHSLEYDEKYLKNNYDLVIHLEIIAKEKPELYGKATNKVRIETASAAIDRDNDLIEVWKDFNKKYYIIDNKNKTMIDKCKLIMDYINAYLLEKENCKFDDLEL